MTYREKFQEGLLDVCQFLELEMKKYLIVEDRFKFRVERYWKIICEQNNKMNISVTEDDIDSYGRILYLLRKSVYSEFRFLKSKRMSPADSIITIIHLILNYSERLGEFKFSEEQKKIKEVIDALWENIRHSIKTITLKNLTGRLNLLLEKELRGSLCYHDLNFEEAENLKPKEHKLTRETKFYQDQSSKKTKEIIL